MELHSQLEQEFGLFDQNIYNNFVSQQRCLQVGKLVRVHAFVAELSTLLLVGRDTCTVVAKTGVDNALCVAPSLRSASPSRRLGNSWDKTVTRIHKKIPYFCEWKQKQGNFINIVKWAIALGCGAEWQLQCCRPWWLQAVWMAVPMVLWLLCNGNSDPTVIHGCLHSSRSVPTGTMGKEGQGLKKTLTHHISIKPTHASPRTHT